MNGKIVVKYTAKTDGPGFNFSNAQTFSMPDDGSGTVAGIRINQNGVSYTIDVSPTGFRVLIEGKSVGNPTNLLVIGEVQIGFHPDAGKWWKRVASSSVKPGETSVVAGTIDLALCADVVP